MKHSESKIKSKIADLYNRMVPKLVAFALRWSGDQVLAEDIVQDAFVQIWKRKNELDWDNELDSLIYSIVRNNLINHYHRKLKEQSSYSRNG